MAKDKPRPQVPDDALLSLPVAISPLLPALFDSPVIGVAVLDSQFRFRAINEALAAMNGLPVSSHVGRKLRYALGGAATKVEDFVREVLETREPIFNRELTAKLPARRDVGHWVETYLPIGDLENGVTQVAALVVEVTGLKNLEVWMNHFIGNVLHMSADLRTELQFAATRGHSADATGGSLPRAIRLIDDCAGQAKATSATSLRDFSADAGSLHFDRDKTRRITINKADMPVRDGGGQWRRTLSPREYEALRLLADCKSNKEIAKEMNISVRTAETYRARVMMKLELRSIGHLIRFAVRNNVIEP